MTENPGLKVRNFLEAVPGVLSRLWSSWPRPLPTDLPTDDEATVIANDKSQPNRRRHKRSGRVYTADVWRQPHAHITVREADGTTETVSLDAALHHATLVTNEASGDPRYEEALDAALLDGIRAGGNRSRRGERRRLRDYES